MGRLLLWVLRGLFGAVIFCASVGPNDVGSNISAWLSRFGLNDLAAKLADQRVDSTAAIVAGLLLALTIILPWWDRRFPVRPVHVFDTEIREAVATGDTMKAEGVVTDRVPLTSIDRERVAEAFRDLHDLLTGDFNAFYKRLAVAGNAPNKLGAFFDTLDDLRVEQAARIRQLADINERHWHYLDMAGVDVGPVLRATDNLYGLLNTVEQARGWPPEAQKERTAKVAEKAGEMNSERTHLLHVLADKRKEYLQ